ncbi:MAG: hypothetical protein U1C58_02035 [Flavobacteriaceae bacterium]|nr:hypothetical protein [Flavobacteriaceae bacterium]MDZ4147042.1 hypothetical protein [Flavobacteriaceae bacterium]
MKKTTKHIVLAAVFFELVSCGQQQNRDNKIGNPKVEDTYKPTFTVTQLYDKFEFSFKQMQPDSFGQIFVDWNRTIKPNSDDFIHQNDTINALFDVYKAFYKPLDLLKLGDWEWGNDLNSKCRYVVVQNKIVYSILLTDNFDDFDWQKSKKDSIENFRPPINLDKNKVLYLTDEYAKSIYIFLGTESAKLGEGNIMNPARPDGDSEKRFEILRPYIPILHGHWGGYWYLETHPNIGIIIFNKTLTKAKIDFRVGYQGGEATLERNGNHWTIKESKATWIE